MRKFTIKVLFIFALGIGAHFHAKAQSDPDGDPDAVPLDPGTWVLVAAGVGYGVKKWKDAKLENKKDDLNSTADFLPNDETKNC